MKRGFYTIMAAQFFSSLADNALLIAAMALLVEMQAPPWMTPLLKLSFGLFYVALAAFVGAFADSLPKGRVMLITNLIKITGCLLMLAGVHPLIAYAIVGFGAAAYSPAKYGILTELLPPEKLVVANGWVEGLTVLSIILGTVLGGTLIGPHVSRMLLGIDLPHDVIHSPADGAILVIACIYLLAAIFNLRIPDTGARYSKQARNPVRLITDFAGCFNVLWKDKLGQISLAITTLIWGAGATLQLLMLQWAGTSLHMPLDQASKLLGVFAVGTALGAAAAARFVPLKKSLSIMPLGLLMGVAVMSMVVVHRLYPACVLLVLIGFLAGYYVVPMNALLQHRGHVLMSAGHSIAVQNFNENLSVLTMLALYAVMLKAHMSVTLIIVLFGLSISSLIALVMRRHARNQQECNAFATVSDRV